jgi:sulfite reductase alpha subunit
MADEDREKPVEDPSVRKGLEMLAELEKGPWPSHVSELKKGTYPIEAYAKGLGQGLPPWFSGSARISCEFTGFIARRTKDGKQTELHFRVYHPSGQFYRTEELRRLLDFADKFGLGSVETVGQTGDLIVPIRPELADPAVDELRALGTDIGGTGDSIRDSAACVGPAMCEYALFDSLAARDFFFRYPAFYDKLSTQLFPFKIKLKFSACPMDCARAVHRADFGFVGYWEGAPEVDQAVLRTKLEANEVSWKGLAAGCPAKAIRWDPAKRELVIDGAKCQKSMNCIRKAFPAIRAGPQRKIAFMVGGHSKGRWGPKMAKPVALLDDYRSAGEFMSRMIDYWSDRSPHKDRLGDLIVKEGFPQMLDRFKDSLPSSPAGKAAGAPRIVTSSVLSEAERAAFAEWADAIAREYEGGG